MKPYVRICLKSRNLTGHEPYCCEYCGKWYSETRFMDCHHIDQRKMGGNKKMDRADNLMIMCRFPCHDDADLNRIPKDKLKEIVSKVLSRVGKAAF